MVHGIVIFRITVFNSRAAIVWCSPYVSTRKLEMYV